MADIYDRGSWPPPEQNPLIRLFEREGEWVSNAELVAALGLSSRRSLGASYGGRSLLRRLGDGDTLIVERNWAFVAPYPMGNTGGQERIFSRKAMVLLSMNIQTVNAAAFRDWVATRIVGEVTDAQA